MAAGLRTREATAGGHEDRAASSARLAAWVFGVYVVAAWFLIVFGLGRYHWFLPDDWDFLADRRVGSVHDLFRPYAEHWSTLPVLAYRLEWHVFGFHYSAYQAVTVTLHLLAAVLLRVVMRRAGVNPWLATAAAALVVLFSPGDQNILWSFQIGMVGSVVFGLVHLILAGRDGPRQRADWLGLAAGLASLMCSSIGLVMVGVVGLAVLLRRGWRMATFHTVPLAVIYLTWFAVFHGDQPKNAGHVGPRALASWLWEAAGGVFDGLGHYALYGLLLALVLVAGLTLAWLPLARAGQWQTLRVRAAEPLSLLVGAIAFQVLTANSRWAFGSEVARSPRYVHVSALLLVPSLAVACDAIGRRWRYAVPALVVLLLVPIPGNIAGFDPDGRIFSERYFRTSREFVEAVGSSPLAARVPGSDRPIRDNLGVEGPPVGWLRDAYLDGRLEAPSHDDPALDDRVRLRLGLAQSFSDATDPAAGMHCRTYEGVFEIDPKRGDRFVIETPVSVRLRDARAPSLFGEPYVPVAGELLRVELDDLMLQMQPLAPAASFRMCS